MVASRSQLASFPATLQPQLTLLPEGVDLDRIKPDRQARLNLPDHGLELKAGQPLVTFISRNGAAARLAPAAASLATGATATA